MPLLSLGAKRHMASAAFVTWRGKRRPASRPSRPPLLVSTCERSGRHGSYRGRPSGPAERCPFPRAEHTVCRMRVWIDLTNSPHVLVMRPVIERCARMATRCAVTARDFAQTLALCERFGIEHTAIGRHRGGAAGGEGAGAGLALGGARALGARRRARGGRARLRHRARPRLQRRVGRRRAAARPELDDVRLRVGDGPAQRQLPSGARGGRARGDPARAPRPLRRARQDARATRGSRRSTTWPTSSPTRRCCDELGARRGAPDRGRAHAAGGLAVPPLRERPVRAACSSACARRRRARACSRWCCRAWPRSAPSCAACRASSCPSARSTRSR